MMMGLKVMGGNNEQAVIRQVQYKCVGDVANI